MADSSATRRFVAPAHAAGRRLDAWLAEQDGAPTRSQLKVASDAGRILVDGCTARASLRLRGGETVDLEAPKRATGEGGTLLAEPIELSILFEDETMAAIDKAPGMVVHPAAGNRSGTLVHALLHRYPALSAWADSGERAGIVHRLDRDTSGVILVAKSPAAHEALARQFRDRSIAKTYLAIVHGHVVAPGRIDAPIGRHPVDRKRMSVSARRARSAVTEYTVRRAFERCSLLEVHPLTGRTHQIRVHLASSGLPIVGDRVYGRRAGVRPSMARQALHASAIEFEHPRGDRRLRIEAPLADDMRRLLASLDGPSKRTERDEEPG